MNPVLLSRVERWLRPWLVSGDPKNAVTCYSKGRKDFLARLVEETPKPYVPPTHLTVRMWNMTFNSPLMNAAGMFKNGEGYDLCVRQGAGAYLGGTTTAYKRDGNEKDGIKHPFVPYPRSGAASNWMGLPNDGDQAVAYRMYYVQRSIPLGMSVMTDSNIQGTEGLLKLVEGMHKYRKMGVQFLEMNQSCPNTGHGKPDFETIEKSLKYVSEHFLQHERAVPVVVKLSNDTKTEDVPQWMDLLFSLGYNGVNFGNTSTDYIGIRPRIHPKEQALFDYFTQIFTGGISGRPLKEKSLELCTAAADYEKNGAPKQEFHVWRTGGIDSAKDLEESRNAGVSMNHWFTGYFENFSKYGHKLYKRLFEKLA